MAMDSRDPDGDSEMASSADSVHTDSDAPGTRTPTHFAHTSAAAASELSPPGSQPQQIPDISATAEFKELGVEAQKSRASSEHPVASWQTKRAHDDYQKAMEYVIDKDFNLHEFGDPFDERDLNEKLA